MMDMKKGMMFGMECYFEELISRDLIKSANFPIVKSIIELYQNGVFEEDVARQKLEKYLPEGVVCSLLSQEELAQLAG